MKILKIAIGGAVAIMLANFFKLEYSTAAGIITLLTIQDTTKETIYISLKRVAAFCIATLLAFSIFNVIGYHAVSFGIFLLLFVGICYLMKFQDAIAMNAVLATHYLVDYNVSISLIRNEFLLLVIGAGIGTLLNLFMPDKVKHIKNTQTTLESDLRVVLSRMSENLVKQSKEGYTGECFHTLEAHIETGLKDAYDNMNNTFMKDTKYFINYMQMRKQQCQILQNIYQKIMTLDYIPKQAIAVADFINHVGISLDETNNVSDLILECQILFQKFQKSDLPSTRYEFESRAVLYMILKDFEYFLKVKKDFVASLSGEQMITYWKL